MFVDVEIGITQCTSSLLAVEDLKQVQNHH